MNKNEKRTELRTLMIQVQKGNMDWYNVAHLGVEWDLDSTEREDLMYSMAYIQRFFEDGQQTAFRGIHWLMDWVDRQSPFA